MVINQKIVDLIKPEVLEFEKNFNRAREIPSNQFTVPTKTTFEKFTSDKELGQVFLKENKYKIMLGGGVLFFYFLQSD